MLIQAADRKQLCTTLTDRPQENDFPTSEQGLCHQRKRGPLLSANTNAYASSTGLASLCLALKVHTDAGKSSSGLALQSKSIRSLSDT